MHITYDLPVVIRDTLEARKRLAGKVCKAGVSRLNCFNERCKGKIFLKFENTQRAGSFRTRGTLNRFSSLIEAEGCKGAVACSVGNHTQGVSLSCAILGTGGKMMISKGIPKPKIAVAYDHSAGVVLYGDNFNGTTAKASEIVETEGRVFIPSYDDLKIITGQGIIGLEILEDLYDVNDVTMPTGGGELTADIAVAIKSVNPTIKIIDVQSENVHNMTASFHVGEITMHRTISTLADGRDAPRSGILIYETVCKLMDDTVPVGENEVRDSMVAPTQRNKVVAESAGMLAYVALLSGKLDSHIQNGEMVSIISGDNIDLSRAS